MRNFGSKFEPVSHDMTRAFLALEEKIKEGLGSSTKNQRWKLVGEVFFKL